MRQAASHARSNDATEEHIEVLDGWDMTLLFVTYLGQSKAARPKKESLDRTLCSCSAWTNQINPNISPTLWHEVQRRIGNTNLLTRLAKCLRNTELKPFKTLLNMNCIWFWSCAGSGQAETQSFSSLQPTLLELKNQKHFATRSAWQIKELGPLHGVCKQMWHCQLIAASCHFRFDVHCMASPSLLFSLSLSRARFLSPPHSIYTCSICSNLVIIYTHRCVLWDCETLQFLWFQLLPLHLFDFVICGS